MRSQDRFGAVAILHPASAAPEATAPPVLLVEDLGKTYGSTPALRGLSFSLKAGRTLGFLGPNGAGKTTAIRILTTVLEPSSGHFFVDGISSDYPKKIRQRIGVLPESMGFAKQATGIECLTFFGRLYGRKAADARDRGMALLQEVGLEHRATSLTGSYSRGMRQRLGIARSLINDPAVVFLDEPTLGLDPRGRQELLSLIRKVAQEHNTGIVLCSHGLSEIESTCDDVVILSAGQVVAKGTVAEVIGSAQRDAVQQNTIRVHVQPPSLAEAQRILAGVPEVKAVAPIAGRAGWLGLELRPVGENGSNGHRASNAALDALIRANIPILSLEAHGSRLQDVFLQVTQETGD
jgi:ABC-2 type transport system ATP-binding protein